MLLAVAGLALGWLWFRDSSFAAVQRVSITGSSSSESDQVRSALETTAHGMSTLHVDEQALEDVVRRSRRSRACACAPTSPTTSGSRCSSTSPSPPVAAGATSVPATGGGLLLEGVRADGLPTIATKAPFDGRHVADRQTLAALAVAAAAPPALRERSRPLFYSEDGLELELRSGPS